jgi:sigma-E factor negative regulatory protein RseA
MTTEQQRQRVSALVDGESGRFEAAATVNDLIRSPELADCWERWHLIGRALRGEPNHMAMRQVAERVRAGIQAQPATERASGRRRAIQSLHAWQPIGGAVAAGLLVLGVALVLTRPADPQISRRIDLAAEPLRQGAERWQQTDPAVRTRLDRLLVTHQEQVAGMGRPGVGAYAAVIGYEPRP